MAKYSYFLEPVSSNKPIKCSRWIKVRM